MFVAEPDDRSRSSPSLINVSRPCGKPAHDWCADKAFVPNMIVPLQIRIRARARRTCAFSFTDANNDRSPAVRVRSGCGVSQFRELNLPAAEQPADAAISAVGHRLVRTNFSAGIRRGSRAMPNGHSPI
jgi:hypothetical protein